MLKLVCLTIVLFAYAPLMTFAYVRQTTEGPTQAPCDEPTPAPLEVFIDVLNSFRDNAILCGHKTTVDTSRSDGGCLGVTFHTTVGWNETARDLCTCMYNYINQHNWLDGASAWCEHQCDAIRLILKGKDDPNYDPNAAAKKNKPLQKLSFVFDKGFNRAQLGDFWCTVDVTGVENIIIQITIEVPQDTECKANDVCDNVHAYLNKPGMLDDSTKTCCYVEGCTDKVLLTYTGNSV